MTGLRRGTKALFHRGYTSYVGRITEPTNNGWGVTVGDTTWDVPAHMLTPLPADTPVLRLGDHARVADDAPKYAGRHGKASSPAFRGGTFGYWMWLTVPTEHVWIPAASLIPGGSLFHLIPADDILATATTTAGCVAAAVHDRSRRTLDVYCSAHGRVYTCSYTPGATVREIEQAREAAADHAAKHAAGCEGTS